MSDLIDKQEAIEAITKYANEHTFNSHYKGMLKARDIVDALPSVEPSSDVISRQAVLDVIHESKANFKNEFDQGFFVDKIKDLPSVHAEPRTGHWINEGQYAEGHSERWYRCSECGGHIIEMIPDDYCKFCGAKMESEEQA